MEIYILDSLFEPIDIVEDYSSVVWAERFKEPGDVTITMPYGAESTKKLRRGVLLGSDKSDRIMRLDTTITDLDEQGSVVMKYEGPSLEGLLKKKVVWGPTIDSTRVRPWGRTGTPVNHIENALTIAGFGVPSAGSHPIDVQNVTNTNLYPPDTFTLTEETRKQVEKPMSAWDYIHELMAEYDIGVRMYRNREQRDNLLYVNTYLGVNRTIDQSDNGVVVFAPELGNITDMRMIDSDRDFHHAVWTWSEVSERQTMYRPYYDNVFHFHDDQGIAIFAHPQSIDNTDDLTPVEYVNLRLQRAREFLHTTDIKISFDGTVDPDSKYEYYKDYNLGDRVTVQTFSGEKERLIVREMLFTMDSEGFKAFPTLGIEDYDAEGKLVAYEISRPEGGKGRVIITGQETGY